MSSGNHLDQLAPDDERARARTAGQTLKRRLENIELRWERCQGSRLSGGDPGDVGFYLGVVLAMPMVPLASSRESGKVFK